MYDGRRPPRRRRQFRLVAKFLALEETLAGEKFLGGCDRGGSACDEDAEFDLDLGHDLMLRVQVLKGDDGVLHALRHLRSEGSVSKHVLDDGVDLDLDLGPVLNDDDGFRRVLLGAEKCQ